MATEQNRRAYSTQGAIAVTLTEISEEGLFLEERYVRNSLRTQCSSRSSLGLLQTLDSTERANSTHSIWIWVDAKQCIATLVVIRRGSSYTEHALDSVMQTEFEKTSGRVC
jgi:hypothetical protein